MAVGKTKKGGAKTGKGGTKKKIADPLLKKEWYDVVAPKTTQITERQCCKTLANKTHGQKRSEDNLKGRVFELHLVDLVGGAEPKMASRKIKLRVDHIQGRSCITNFHGMSLTTDKMKSLIKKRCSLIEAKVNLKTTDGFLLRIFFLGFTDKAKGQVKKNCFAQSSQVRAIRKRMVEVCQQKLGKCDLQACLTKFVDEVPAVDIPKQVNKSIFPLKEVIIRKVKVIKMPKFDLGKLMDAHGNDIPASEEERGQAVV